MTGTNYTYGFPYSNKKELMTLYDFPWTDITGYNDAYHSLQLYFGAGNVFNLAQNPLGEMTRLDIPYSDMIGSNDTSCWSFQ